MIFEGKYPLGQAFTGQWHEGELFNDLGQKFKVMELYFKLYACCAFIHPGLDGLLDIQKSDGVRAEDIESIILRFPKSGYKVIDNNALRSHCAQYVLALAATKGYVYFHDILEDQRSDPGIKALSEHVTVVGDEELDRTYPDLYRSIIEVKTHSGACYKRDITHPRGSPEKPLSDKELREKFSALTREVISPSRAEAITKTIEHLEDLSDVSSLTSLLAKEAKGGG